MKNKYRIVEYEGEFYPQKRGLIWGWNDFTETFDGETWFCRCSSFKEAEKYMKKIYSTR